jgi:hypothetical protein
MNTRVGAHLGWSLWLLTLILTVLSLAFSGLNTAQQPQFVAGDLTFVVVALAFSTMGALIVSRHPENSVGWVFYAVGILFVTSNLTTEYGIFATITEDGAWPAGPYVAGLSTIGATAFGLMAGPLLLLFPTGKLLSRKLAPLLWLAMVGAALAAIGEALTPGVLEAPLDSVANPTVSTAQAKYPAV